MNEKTLEAFEKWFWSCNSDEYNKSEYEIAMRAWEACKEALAQPTQEPKCSEHPDAPHGFCRDASHSADRYVCECELWEEPTQEPVATLKITSLGEYDLTLNVPTELHYKALIDAVGIGNHSLFIDGSQSSIGGCCNCKASKGIIGSSTFCDPHPAPLQNEFAKTKSWQVLG